MENEPQKLELPAGLSWSNTLATLSPLPLLVTAREAFRDLLEASPEDMELQERVRGYFEEARAGLSREENSEEMLEALGVFEDILPSADSEHEQQT